MLAPSKHRFKMAVINFFHEALKNISKRVPVLTFICVFFALGILTGRFVNIPFFVCLLLSLAALLGAYLFLNKEGEFDFYFLLLALLLGALHIINHTIAPSNHIRYLTKNKSQTVTLKGVIENDPAIKKGRVSFIINAQGLHGGGRWHNAQGRVLVNFPSGDNLNYGDQLILKGKLHAPFDFYAHKGGFSYKGYLNNRGIYNILEVKRDGGVVFLGISKEINPLKKFSFRLKHSLRNIFNKSLPELNSSLLNAVILGERQGLPKEIRRVFAETSTAHIIAISGFHVGIIAFAVFFFFKSAGLKMKARSFLTALVLIIYCLAVGSSASVVRATIMALVLLFSCFTERDVQVINSLSLAALIILAVNPLEVFDAGFQLSFASVAGIVFLSPRISGLLKRSPRSNPVIRFIIESFSVSASAWVSTLGLTIYYFRVFSPIAVFANLLVVPLISLVIILGILLVLTHAVLPVLTYSIAANINFILAVLFKAGFWLKSLPFSSFYL